MILLLLLLLFALKFNYQVLYLDYLIGFVILAAVVSFGICLYVSKTLVLYIDSEDRWMKEGESVWLKLIVDSPAFRTNIIPEVELKVLQTGETETQSGVCAEMGSVFEFKDLKPGTVRLAVDRVKIKSLFGTFSIRKKVNYEKIFSVYPKKAPVNYNHVRKAYIPGEGEILNAKGDDYTEIYEVRPIQDGDDLKHVHRALSAKYDEYIIKVGSDSRKAQYSFYLGDGEEFSVMLNLLGQLTELREKLIKDEGAYITAVYKGGIKELVYDSQLYELIDEVYADYLPQKKAADD